MSNLFKTKKKIIDHFFWVEWKWIFVVIVLYYSLDSYENVYVGGWNNTKYKNLKTYNNIWKEVDTRSNEKKNNIKALNDEK